MSNCVYICLEEECKVLGPDSDAKWVIGATTGVVGWRTPLMKHPIYLVFFNAFIASITS